MNDHSAWEALRTATLMAALKRRKELSEPAEAATDRLSKNQGGARLKKSRRLVISLSRRLSALYSC